MRGQTMTGSWNQDDGYQGFSPEKKLVTTHEAYPAAHHTLAGLFFPVYLPYGQMTIMKRGMYFTGLMLLLSFCQLQASGIRVSDLTWYYEGNPASRSSYCLLTLQWDHAWNTAKNHDAAWVFFKFNRPGAAFRHAYILKDGVKMVADHSGGKIKYSIKISDDQAGFFIHPADRYQGQVQLTLRVNLDMSKTGNIGPSTGVTLQGYGIEMVHIPGGPFFVGEADSAAARQFHSFYLSDAEGKHAGLFEIKKEEEEIPVGKGSLFYSATETNYQGDMKGIISTDFPKGVRGFYCMKYELTQGQYAAFLNSLAPGQNTARANTGGSQYYALRGTIRYTGTTFVAESPDRPCNFISWDDAMAYADWAALRPMTELEFTKAARGPQRPSPNSFPWGNNSKEKIRRVVNAGGDLVWNNGLEEKNLSDARLEEYGASWYWVMDLAGSLWERVITIGDEKGRSFTGVHGDGQLTGYGFANVKNWPAGNEETGGFGFRGGGFYSHDRSYHEFNPYSPVSYRMYGAWSGGARTEAYGSRFVRTE